jgi:hypothetical protein
MYFLIMPLFALLLFQLSPILIPAAINSQKREARRLQSAVKSPWHNAARPRPARP